MEGVVLYTNERQLTSLRDMLAKAARALESDGVASKIPVGPRLALLRTNSHTVVVCWARCTIHFEGSWSARDLALALRHIAFEAWAERTLH